MCAFCHLSGWDPGSTKPDGRMLGRSVAASCGCGQVGGLVAAGQLFSMQDGTPSLPRDTGQSASAQVTVQGRTGDLT